MNKFLQLSFLWTYLAQGTLHPALTPDLPSLQAVWHNGYAYAQHNKSLYRPLKLARHGIGKMDGHWVSWVTFLHPRLVAYEEGFVANKQHLSTDQQAASLSGLAQVTQEQPKQLRFHVDLGIYPAGAFAAGAGTYRKANPSALQGVRVRLQVGDRVYEPLQQPETIAPDERKDWHSYSIPSSTGDGTTIALSERFTWYRGQFDVRFALYNADGTLRVTEKDTKIMVLVGGAFGQQKATFNLDEWQNAYEK